MRAIQHPYWRYSPSRFLTGIAVAILAFHPVLWLVNTWRDPSYASQGFIVFAVCLSLFLWSVSSRRLTCQPVERTAPYVLLGLSALIRLIGQVFAINMIGALTLVFDVYAISRLCGLHLRARHVSPLWLSVCFAFSLPLERLLQRTIGYGLQHLSADGACLALSSLYGQVQCAGVRIMINTQDVLVDLPCSGARCLLLLLLFYFLCAAVSRFRIRAVISGFLLTLAAALGANVLRITLLATGIAYPEKLGGIDVMAQPWHDLIGLLTLGIGALPIVLWTRTFYRPNKVLHFVLDQARWGVPRSLKQDGWWLVSRKTKPTRMPALAAGVLVMVAVTIVNLPRHAVDVAERNIALSLPSFIHDAQAVEIPLTPMETAYFQQYGGSVQKAGYGDHSLMVVKTTAPLRHLHAPDECLRGAGMDVEYKGLVYDPLPTAIYKATDDNNISYRIAVTFVSEGQSHVTTNVSEAVWHWIQNPKEDWMAVQRISRWETPAEDAHRFDQAVMAALDIQTPETPFELATLEEGLSQ